MAVALGDGIHVAGTLARAGILRPSRPDRALRAIVGLHRFGPTLAAGYLGAAARYPDAPALIDERGSLTFGEVDRRTNALARGLAGHGLTEGDAVALMCRNHRGFVEASLACSKLGVHAVFLNTGFAGPQVAEVVDREKVAGIIYDDEFTDVVTDALTTRRQLVGLIAWRDDQVSTAGADVTLDELIATRVDTPLPAPRQAGRAVILTSGTTGTPKGANRPNPSSLSPVAAILSVIPLRARQTTLIAAPLFHAWGYAHMLLAASLSATLVLRRRFDPEDMVRTMAAEHVNALIVVPVMLQRILECGLDRLGAHDTSALSVIAVSGSALPGPLAHRVMDAFGETLYNLYGSTEVAWATIASPDDLRAAPGTAGRMPRGTIVRIFDERGEEVPTGATGRIFVGSELLFDGYTGGGDKDRLAGLMATGDVGHFDFDGRLFIDGRDDDMIVSGGENVFPAEVEDLLAAVPGVREVAVVGVADAEFGQRLRAIVSLAPGAELTESALQEHVRRHLARYKVPREIVFVDQLPRNATGKILKRELR
ncbi:MAG TPA: AMP-binding protein [Solirubrobacteraceae bacterium]|jgi:fatty-acyl-CoA synthase|nr:AMP-binding protein [Solirubrobacteraceae bacterium]